MTIGTENCIFSEFIVYLTQVYTENHKKIDFIRMFMEKRAFFLPKRKSGGLIPVVFALCFAVTLTSCVNSRSRLHDGYFTAEADDFDTHGWKEFISICVNNGSITTVEYNAMDRGDLSNPGTWTICGS
jgi:hypothetical protein